VIGLQEELVGVVVQMTTSWLVGDIVWKGPFLDMWVFLHWKQFLVNSEIYLIDPRQHANFHYPSVNWTKYQKRVNYLGVKYASFLY